MIKGRSGYSLETSKKPLKDTKILFGGRGLKFFSPLQDANSKTTMLTDNFIILKIAIKIDSSMPQKILHKAPAVDLFRLKDVRANCFCTSLLRTQIRMPCHT